MSIGNYIECKNFDAEDVFGMFENVSDEYGEIKKMSITNFVFVKHHQIDYACCISPVRDKKGKILCTGDNVMVVGINKTLEVDHIYAKIRNLFEKNNISVETTLSVKDLRDKQEQPEA